MGRPRTAIPASVSRVRVRVERWRERRVKRGSMPEELWDAAVWLARTHGICPVARALRLDYGALKRRVARSSRTGAKGPGRAGGFVEIAPAQLVRGLEPSGAVVEVWEADGTKLVVRLPGREGLDVLALVQAFRRRRS